MESKKDQASPFDFTLKTGPDDYYKDARDIVQGKMASLSELIRDAGVDLSVQGDIPTLSILPEDATKGEISEGKTDATEIQVVEDSKDVTRSPASATTQSSKNDTPSTSNVAGQERAKFLGLLEGTPALKISNRSAINTAAGDTVTEAIFTLLGNPAKTAQFKDKLMLFGVSMVSITPGYVTKEGYTGELSVSCSYKYYQARRELLEKIKKVEESKECKDRDETLFCLVKKVLDKGTRKAICKIKIPQRYQKGFREDSTPLAAAVSPMTDVDALDLSSSIRNQTFSAMKISAALSYAGLTGQAGIFDEWAKKLEQETQTRTSYAAITAFSNGPHFGFRIRPRLKAIMDGKAPGYELENQSFPVAVIIGIDTDDLKLAFECKEGKLVAYEPMIKFHQTTNWLPNDEVSLWDMVNGTCAWDIFCGNYLIESKRLKWLESYNIALKKSKDKKLTDYNYYKEYVENRIELLGNQILDAYCSQYLPMKFLVGKVAPTVDKPNKLFTRWYDVPSTYVIKGKNFEGQVLGANIEGQPCKVDIMGDKTVIITSPGWKPKLDVAIALAEKKIAEAELGIIKANKKINEAQNRINDANDILKRNSTDQNAVKEKKKALNDLNNAIYALETASANKKSAEANRKIAMAQVVTSKELKINLITTKGSIRAGYVEFANQATPVKTKASSSGTTKADPTLTITRNAANKILTISSKGEAKEVDKLIDIVKEGEKKGANVDLKFNASGQVEAKAGNK
jgi:hypothetical protein